MRVESSAGGRRAHIVGRRLAMLVFVFVCLLSGHQSRLDFGAAPRSVSTGGARGRVRGRRQYIWGRRPFFFFVDMSVSISIAIECVVRCCSSVCCVVCVVRRFSCVCFVIECVAVLFVCVCRLWCRLTRLMRRLFFCVGMC